jgi:integrating conjugative element protein (TIGR03765 family)
MMRRFIGFLAIAAITSSFILSSANAEPSKVIAVVGQSTPVSNYLGFISQSKTQQVASIQHKKAFEFSYAAESSLLSMGKVTTRAVDIKNLIRPIFIVGTGKASLAWLKKYQVRLKSLGALGILTNISSNKGYEQIVKETGLHLLPLNANEIAVKFGIKHYPVLISKHLIEQ